MILHVNEKGVILVGSTRIPIETIIDAHREGYSAEEIASQYPSLTARTVKEVVDYYLTHKEEMEQYYAARKAFAQRVRQENERRWPSIHRECLAERKSLLCNSRVLP